MTTTDDDQPPVRERLIASLKKLGVFSRVDADDRILVFDGKQEYEVVVDLSRLLRKQDGGYSRTIVIGRSSLLRLDKGDVRELFPKGVVAPRAAAAGDDQMASNYSPLQWDNDARSLMQGEVITAQSDDWTYEVSPICGDDDEVIGYRVTGGDFESGDRFGSSLIRGEIGEFTLSDAKAAAEANYAARYREAEDLLADLCERDEYGRLVCQLDETGVEKVGVVATLRDWGDRYNADGTVTICLRTILTCSGDPSVLRDEVRRISGGD